MDSNYIHLASGFYLHVSYMSTRNLCFLTKLICVNYVICIDQLIYGCQLSTTTLTKIINMTNATKLTNKTNLTNIINMINTTKLINITLITNINSMCTTT